MNNAIKCGECRLYSGRECMARRDKTEDCLRNQLDATRNNLHSLIQVTERLVNVVAPMGDRRAIDARSDAEAILAKLGDNHG
jgi:hypothetical protein